MVAPMNRLTQANIDELAGALHRLNELNTKVIKETTDAAEARGLTAFLQANALPHLEEFLACWITIQQEYRPLLQGVTGLLGNAFQLLQRQQEARNPQPTAASNTCECAPGTEKECKEKCGDGCVCTATETK
jgi:hypothetical protein